MTRILLSSLCTLLWLTAWAWGGACSREDMPFAQTSAFQRSTSTQNAAKRAAEAEAKDMKSVRVYFQTAHARASQAGYALVSDLGEVIYELQSCRSGFAQSFSSLDADPLSLYRFDRSCAIKVVSFTIGATLYTQSAEVPFDPAVGAVNSFSSAAGDRVYLTVRNQLPEVLEASYYPVNFLVSEAREGLAITLSVYEVGISVDVPEIVEGSRALATFTVSRAAPGPNPLTIHIAHEGDATPGIDTSVLPSTVILPAGQASQSFALSITNDDIGEASELLRLRIKPGVNYFPKDIAADLIIKDNDVGVLQSEFVSYDFLRRTLNLPHVMQVKLSNVGRGWVSDLQTPGLSPPFYFPGGFLGDGGNCGAGLAPGQSCSMSLAFSTNSTAISSGEVILNYFNGVDPAQASFKVAGRGGNAAYLRFASGPSFDFGPTLSGVSLQKHMRITNFGSASASSLSGSFSSPHFKFLGGSYPGTGGSCGTSLGAGDSCTIVLSFGADSSGYYDDLLQISYSNGSQTLREGLDLSAAVNDILAPSLVLTTAVSTPVALTLSAQGNGLGLSYEILSQPRFGSLSGQPPNLVYTPQEGFDRIDSFVYRALDAQGYSDPAMVKILVAPQALLVAPSTQLNSIDTAVSKRLQALGFSVTILDDNDAEESDAYGRDLLLVSSEVRTNRIRNKFNLASIPLMVWNRNLYSEFDMVGSGFNSGTVTNRSIRILDTDHPLTAPFPATDVDVFTSNLDMNFINGNHPNLQKLASVSSNSNRIVLFAYEKDAALPGQTLAPARRVGSFLPASNNLLTNDGRTLFDQSVDWLMQSELAIFHESFQRENNLSLGEAWQEFEAGDNGDFQIAEGQLALHTQGDVSSIKASFALQTEGRISLSFYLDLVPGSTPNPNYLLDLQLGRCDRMDKDLPLESGAAVHLVWGGLRSGLNAEQGLGYRKGDRITTLGTVQQRLTPIRVSVDLDARTYRVHLPQGGSSTALPFDSVNEIDCLRISSRHINADSFKFRALQDMTIVKGE